MSLSSRGSTGDLDVMLPNNHIRNPRTHGTSISHFYAYKFSKSAFTGIQGAKATYTTHVSIDDNGLLKVRWESQSTCHGQQFQYYNQNCPRQPANAGPGGKQQHESPCAHVRHTSASTHCCRLCICFQGHKPLLWLDHKLLKCRQISSCRMCCNLCSMMN